MALRLAETRREDAQLWRLLAGFFLATAPAVMATPMIALGLAARGVDAALIGALAAVGSVAYMVALPATPALMARIGATATFRLALVAGTTALAGLAATDAPALWVALFALAGLAAGLRYTVAESWVPALAAPAARGRAMALFQTAVGAAAFVGAGLLMLTGVEGPAPRAVILALAAASLVVLWGLRAPAVAEPAPAAAPDQGGGGLRGALAQVGPLVLAAALLGGLFESGLTVALPLYGLEMGLSTALAAGLVTATGLGSLAQFPFGYLADRLPWPRVVVGAAAVIAASATLLPLAQGWPAILLGLGVLWGAVGGGLYTLASIRNGELWRGPDLVRASVVTQFAYMLGEAGGPALGGLALDLAPRYGLPGLVAGAGLVILGAMLWAGRARAGAPAPEPGRA
jgi:MFS family permease